MTAKLILVLSRVVVAAAANSARHGVISTGVERVALAYTLCTQQGASHWALFLYRLHRVFRAGRIKAAARPNNRS